MASKEEQEKIIEYWYRQILQQKFQVVDIITIITNFGASYI